MVLRTGAPVDIVAPKEGVLAFERLPWSGRVLKDRPPSQLCARRQRAARHGEPSTSPCNKASELDDEIRKRTPIVGDRMSESRSYNWDSYVDKAADIADRWNREMA